MSLTDELFASIVAEQMASFCTEFGFKETRRNSRSVRFKSKRIYLTFDHSRTHEVYVTFGRTGVLSALVPSFSIFDILYAKSPPLAKSWRMRSATTPEQILESVREIVLILSTHGKELLSGDSSSLDRASSQQAERQALFVREMEASSIRPNAEAAFRAGDYVKAVQLYQSIRMVLTAVELRKLAIAEKKLQCDPNDR